MARGRLEQAESEYQAALDLWTSIGYAAGVAIARTGLGIARVEQGAHGDAREHLETALREWDQQGSRTYVSETQRYLAQALMPADRDLALEWAERAVATARDLTARDQEGIALRVLGVVRLERSEVEEGIAALEASRELLRATTERQELARTLAALGRAYLALPAGDDRRRDAERLVSEARATFAELGAKLDMERLAF